jgi:hypothetical protein
MEFKPELFRNQVRRRFGKANPERMQCELWEWTIHENVQPYRLRELLEIDFQPGDEPIWTFKGRMGATRTELSDGRVISVAGEYEDSYDPDFCIYNDVVVRGPGERLEIYGYPAEIFPPTDFHSATLIDSQIVLVGSIGYSKARRAGYTPVYSLDVNNYSIREIKTTGENPGWISRHEAQPMSAGVIRIRGGQRFEAGNERLIIRKNVEEFVLDTKSWSWEQTTKRNWHQASIRQVDKGMFVLEKQPEVEAVLGGIAEFERVSWNQARFVYEGVPVLLFLEVSSVEIVIEGKMASETRQVLLEKMLRNVEVASGKACRIM